MLDYVVSKDGHVASFIRTDCDLQDIALSTLLVRPIYRNKKTESEFFVLSRMNNVDDYSSKDAGAEVVFEGGGLTQLVSRLKGSPSSSAQLVQSSLVWFGLDGLDSKWLVSGGHAFIRPELDFQFWPTSKISYLLNLFDGVR